MTSRGLVARRWSVLEQGELERRTPGDRSIDHKTVDECRQNLATAGLNECRHASFSQTLFRANMERDFFRVGRHDTGAAQSESTRVAVGEPLHDALQSSEWSSRRVQLSALTALVSALAGTRTATLGADSGRHGAAVRGISERGKWHRRHSSQLVPPS